jgi:hypothetical protein
MNLVTPDITLAWKEPANFVNLLTAEITFDWKEQEETSIVESLLLLELVFCLLPGGALVWVIGESVLFESLITMVEKGVVSR